jgi:hypothetical protein
MHNQRGHGKFKDAYSGTVPLTERRAGYAICGTPERCSKKEISKALWFSARNGSEVLGDWLGRSSAIEAQKMEKA